MVLQGVLCPCASHDLGPNGSLFANPKNSKKASCICNMVLFHTAHGGNAPPWRLPSVELVGVLRLLQWNDHPDFVPPSCSSVVGDEVIFTQQRMAALKANPPCVRCCAVVTWTSVTASSP